MIKLVIDKIKSINLRDKMVTLEEDGLVISMWFNYQFVSVDTISGRLLDLNKYNEKIPLIVEDKSNGGQFVINSCKTE